MKTMVAVKNGRGGEEEKCHSSYQRSYLSTHDLKTVV